MSRLTQSRQLDLLVAGHTNVDHFLDVERLPQVDRTVPLTDQRTALGGTAATIARWAARGGVTTGLLSVVGDDFPRAFERTLRSEGVDLRGLHRVRGARTPACYIVEDGRGSQFTLIHQGPMGHVVAVAVPRSLLRATRWLHLTTGDPTFQLKLKEAARRLNVPVAVDPAQEIHYRWNGQTLRRLIDGAEVLFGNRDEIDRAMELLRVSDRPSLLAKVPLVIETQGAKGAVAWSRRGSFRVPPARPRRIRHVTGAGDAFRGGFYTAWFAGLSLPDCLRAAAIAATRCIEGADRIPSHSRGTAEKTR